MKDSDLITELLQKVEQKDITIKNQAKVIRENWSELQAFKRILIDEYGDVWREIQSKIKCPIERANNEYEGRADHTDGSVSIRIRRETIDKLLDWVENEQRRLKGLPKRKKTVLKFDI
jgi:uncharacterized protein YydD (DUF2326 family)